MRNGAERWATAGVAVMGLLTAASCTALLGIDKDYHKDAIDEGGGGGCIASEGHVCLKTCSGAVDPGCGGFACDRGVCLTRCEGAADCIGGAYCEATICVGKKELGASCDGDPQCKNGLCENGVCCAARCGTCQDCDATGTCKNIDAEENDSDSCAAPRACDGLGRCLQVAGDPCILSDNCRAPLQCSDGLCCDKDCNSACLSCNVMGAQGTCTPLGVNEIDDKPVCGGLMDSKRACNGAGACALVKGQPCTMNSQCVSGNCSGTPTTCQ
jgi:hypothetical protein